MAHQTPPSLLRGMLAGLGAGALLASAALLVQSVKALELPCDSPSVTECAFQDATQAELARMLRLAAGGLGILGIGSLWWLRTLSQRPKAP